MPAKPAPQIGRSWTATRSTTLRRSLFLRFGALAAGSVALLGLGYVLFGLQPVAERIARSHFSAAVQRVDSDLDQLFNPIVGLLGISREWVLHPGLSVDRPDDFNRLFQPVLRQFKQLTSVVAGDTRGQGFLLLELPDGRWRNRFTDVPRSGKQQRFVDWHESGAKVVRHEISDYDPRTRPWFKSAMSGPDNGQVHWTEPYTFFTTKDPGITGSSRVDLPDGRSFVIGFDIKLLDITRITAGLTVGKRGSAMVLTNDGKLLGLPNSDLGAGADVVRATVLKPVEVLGVPALTNAIARWNSVGKVAATELRYTAGGEDWVATFRPFVLGDQMFWTVAMAPLADFMPPWHTLAASLLGIMVLVLLLSLLMARRFTSQFSAPLESLVASSERIARLDFDPAEPAQTHLVELQRLAAAQEGMRHMLSEFRSTVDAQSADLKDQIAALRATEARLAHLSQHDPLTDLPNRILFNDRLRHAIMRARRSKNLFAVLFLDLDNFKTLNDTRGHEAGDRLLIEVARRLRARMREDDSVARLGGDEFIVLVEDLSPTLREAALQAEGLAEKIRASLAEPYVIDGHHHRTTASIGVALFRGGDESGDMLMRAADGAMYTAKRNGRNTVYFFDPEMQAELHAASQLEIDLRHALPEGQLVLHFQGKYDRELRMTGAEALLRWRHPTHGMVSPAEFIPIAEKSGIIIPIGLWVIEAACAQLKTWAAAPHTRGLRLAVNVSPFQFRHAGFMDDIKGIMARHDIDAKCLTLELTESVVLDNVADSIAKMRALSAMGIGLAMDDFGTGYSSLSHLSRLPVDEVKIDQSFTRNLGNVSSDAIVHAIIGMARSLRMSVTAEGVETREQLEWLMREGCDTFQGYLFSRPAPAAQFATQQINPPDIGWRDPGRTAAG